MIGIGLDDTKERVRKFNLEMCIEQIKGWYEKWNPEYFHLPPHFERVERSGIHYIAKIVGGDEDVLGLNEDLSKYNQEKGTQFELKDFLQAQSWMAWTHDLGNGMAGLSRGKPDWFSQMIADGAEDRSIIIAKELMSEVKVDEKMQKLVLHLIDQTRFEKDEKIFLTQREEKSKIPFWRFAQAIDQVGQARVGEQKKRDLSVRGLMVELKLKELEEKKSIPDWMNEFPAKRLHLLLDDRVKEKIFENMFLHQ